MKVVAFVLGVALVAYSIPVRAAEVVEGKNITFAGTTPMTAFLRITPGAAGAVRVDAWEVRREQTVRTYDVDMTKLMHMIVVSDDFTDFQHVHPILLPNGHLTIDVRELHPDQAYHIYLDGIPHGAGRHVFRFDVPSATASKDAPLRYLHHAGSSVDVGPYTVIIDPTSVPIGEIATISVRILKNGRPANDLHPYLGVMSHGVLLGTKDLAYMHAHGMTAQMLDMSSASDCGDSMMMQMTPMPPNLNIGNEFELQILAPSEQDYDLWLQFIGGKTLYTAPLLVTTR